MRVIPSSAWRNSGSRSLVAGKGYILLFTLGVLAVISVLVLSIALSLRLDAQLIGREKARLQDEYALNGAVQYAVARLTVTLELQRQLAGKPPDAVARRKIWLPEEGPYSMEFAGVPMTVAFDDAGVLPDANLLSEQEWLRLLVELGANANQPSLPYVKALMESKLRVAKSRGSLGFLSMRELINSQSLPQHLTRGVNSQVGFGIHDALVVGTELKQLDINRSPLVLFKVLAGFSDGQLANLQLSRSRGPISPIEGQKLLASTPAKLMAEKSDMLRVRINMNNDTAPSGGAMVIALLKKNNNTYKVVDQYMADPH